MQPPKRGAVSGEAAADALERRVNRPKPKPSPSPTPRAKQPWDDPLPDTSPEPAPTPKPRPTPRPTPTPPPSIADDAYGKAEREKKKKDEIARRSKPASNAWQDWRW